jgi:hypothetical protein
MNKEYQTTPLQNILSEDPSDPRNQQYVSEFIFLRPWNISSIELNKSKLGKQKYCVSIGTLRCWVWEGESWRAYVSKEGLSFEVLLSLSIDKAWSAWQEYRNRIIR